MANWNLSVDLRGQGSNLAATLRDSARESRGLARDARKARTEIRGLGTDANAAATRITRLGVASSTAQRRLLRMSRQAKQSARDLRDVADAADAADARLRAVGGDVRLNARLDDDTATGAASVRAVVAALSSLSPVAIRALVDNDTAPGAAAVRTTVAGLSGLGPVRIGARLDDDTAPGAAALRATVAGLSSLGPVVVAARIDDNTAAGAATARSTVAGLGSLGPVAIRALIDDDTAPGAATVRSTVADLATLGPVAIRARVDNDTGTGAAAVHAAVAGLSTLGPVRIPVQVDADTAQIAAVGAAVTAALADIRNESRDTSRALLLLAARARRTARELDDLADRARAAATGIRTLGDAARTASGNVGDLSTNSRTLRGDLDGLDGSVTRLSGNLNGLRGTIGTVNTSGNNMAGTIRTVLIAAGLLATGIIPVAASLAPIAAGLTASAVAAGAFGVAIAGQIMAVTEASEAQEKYDDAVREHGKASEQAVTAEREYLRLVEEMPPATQEAAAAVSVLKDEYKAYSDALAEDTMPVAIKGMGLLQAMLPKTAGLARGASAEFEHMLDVLAGASQTEGFDKMNAKFTEFATSTLAKATSGAVKFATSMDTGEIGGDWREFMDYAREVAPQVGDVLSELGTTMLHLLIAGSDLGVGVLQVVEALAALINAVPPEALAVFLQLYAVMKLVSLGMAAVGAVAGGAAIANLAAFHRSLMFGGVGPAITGVVQRMSALQKASIGLGVLAVAALGINKLAENARGAPPDIDRLTTSLKELAQTGKFGGELKKTFGDMDGLIDKIKKLQVETERANKSDGFEIPGISHFSDWVGDVSNDLAKGEESLEALKEDFEGLDGVMAEMVSSGYGKQAAADFDLIKAAAVKAGIPISEINALLPQYNAALAAAKVEQQLAIAGMGLFGQQAFDVKDKLDAQRASADGLRGAIQALNDVNRSALGAQNAFEAAIDDAAAAAKKHAGELKMINGVLDLSSEGARENEASLRALAAATDENAASARAAGKPWSEVNAIYARGQAELIKTAQSMGLTAGQAKILADRILGIPAEKDIIVDMIREDAIAGLDEVINKIKATPGSKSVTVDALTAEAMKLLEGLGFKTERLPDGRVTVTAITGSALSNIGAVQAARDRLNDRTITITTNYVVTGNLARRPGVYGSQIREADGGVVDYYADGGIRSGRVQQFADGGSPDTRNGHVAHIAPAGTWRVFAEDETGGEAYVPLHPSKRPRSRAITEETVRRLGGDPAQIKWNAQGSVTDWKYDPRTGSLYSPMDAGQAGRKTKKVKGKEVSYFDLGAVERKLKSASSATRVWNRDLEKVADRAGGDVAEALAAMGDEGVALARKMARGSTGYLNQMAAALRGLAATAKASLTDYTRSLTKATAVDEKFAANLATLAGRGYGDLASQLAAQGDQSAMELAASAVADRRKAGAANTAAQRANTALTSDQVQQLVAIIAAVRSSKTGLHDVADSTGMGEDDIVAIATKARGQISSSLGARATKFLADLARAQKGLSYADGGIRSGIYSTTGGAVTFAEPQTGGEAFIPLGAHKRRQATNVLRDVAGRFGIGLTDVSASRQVVVIKDGNTYITVPAVRTGASASDIGFQVGRSYRRARRGGVSARA